MAEKGPPLPGPFLRKYVAEKEKRTPGDPGCRQRLWLKLRQRVLR
jgi:hypothetical protein